MQLSITIGLFAALAYFEFWPSTREKEERHNSLALSTVLVDFHKYQCYYVCAIQIAALVLHGQAQNAYDHSDPPPVHDIFLSIPLSLSGIVPIVFTLACISRYARLSWLIVVLSMITVVLSTGTLASTYALIKRSSYDHGTGRAGISQAESAYSRGLAMAKLVCGSKAQNLENVINTTDFSFLGVWATFTICIIWLLWLIVRRIRNRKPENSQQDEAVVISEERASNSSPGKIHPSQKLAMGAIVFVVICVICFTFHFYLYGAFIRARLVSTEWSFGQTIAVTVWLPSMVELFYIRWSKLTKFKSALQADETDVVVTYRGHTESVKI